jgi:hypothetical protein
LPKLLGKLEKPMDACLNATSQKGALNMHSQQGNGNKKSPAIKAAKWILPVIQECA